MKNIRWFALLAALILVAPTLASFPADARPGGGQGSGSKGSKTDQTAPPTQTAPSSKPVERSTTPQQAQKPAPGATAPGAPAPGGFMSRNPFMSGLMGGMLGAGLMGMMFGGGLGGGLSGGAGFLGLLIQLALIGGIGYLAYRLYRSWSANRAQPAGMAHAYAAPAMNATPRLSNGPELAGGSFGASMAGGAQPQLAIATEDYQAFEGLLSGIQTAYSKGDLAALRGLATPEMVGYFSEELSANASRGVENRCEAVKLEQGDLAEAWSEGAMDYATVAMRFSMIETTRQIADGRIVEGNEQVRTEVTEVWTFLRSGGGKWILSAIQQT